MSIIVGKRNFAENFSELMISDFSRDTLYRTKMTLNEKNVLNRGNPGQINQTLLLENAKILKQQFQGVDDKVKLSIEAMLTTCPIGNICHLRRLRQ